MIEKLTSFPFLLFVIWWSLLLFVDPIGDFPLNDDWAYAHNVQALIVGHEIYFSDWPAMTLIAHTLWGALFCKVFGFSFTVLRFSTLVMGYIGLLATYALFKESHFSKKHAFWCTLLIGFNPLYFSLSYTYMTDVPFVTFMVLASLYFIKTLNDKGDHNIIIATVFSIVAVLIRQLGILMPLAFLFVFLIKNKTTLKTVFQAVTPLFTSYGIMATFIHWREINYGLSDTFGSSSTLIKTITWGKFNFFLHHLAPVFTSYWGFFLLPLSILIFSFFWKNSSRKILIGSTPITMLLLFLYWRKWQFNILGNVIYNFGLGPRIISHYSDNVPFHLSTTTWEGIKAFTFFTGVILVFIFANLLLHFLQNSFSKKINSPLKYFPFDPIKCFAFLAVSIYLGFLIFNNYYFDRYHLPLLPFFILIIFPKKTKDLHFPKWSLALACIFFVMQILYSVGSTRDYLTYSRMNWKMIHQNMTQHQIPTHHIGGGFEFNSWYKHGRTQPKGWYQKEWWLKNEKNYLADFGTLCGFTNIDSMVYQQVFPLIKDTLYFSEKNKLTIHETITCGAESITYDSLHFVANDSTILLQNTDTRTTDRTHSGQYASKLNGKKQYAFTLKLQNVQPCEKIWIEVWRYPVHSHAAIVVTANEPKAFYQLENKWVFKKDDSGWGLLSTGVTVPENYQDTTLNFYLYNPSQKEVWFDDLKIVRARFD